MTPEQEMSLQVQASPSLPSHIDKIVQERLKVNGNSDGMSSPGGRNALNTMVGDSHANSPEGLDTSIVTRPAQSSRDLENLLRSTGRHEFEEHPHLRSDTKTHDAHQMAMESSIHSASITSYLGDDNNESNSFQHTAEATGVDIVNHSLVKTSDFVATTRLEQSHAGNKQKPTETPNREQTPYHTIDITSTNSSSTPSFETQPQHLASNIPLAYPLTTSTHAATAAEIALGISSPYNQRPNLRNHTAMANDTRNQPWVTQQGLSGSKGEGNLSITESSAQVKQGGYEENRSRTPETGIATSPVRLSSGNESDLPRPLVGTPSTISTAPSTDDASLNTDYKLEDSILPHLLQDSLSGNPWTEEGLLLGPKAEGTQQHEEQGSFWMQPGRGPVIQPIWEGAQPNQQQQRVASFRGIHGERYPHTTMNGNDQSWQHKPSQPTTQHHHRQFQNDHMQYLGQHDRGIAMDSRQGRGYANSSMIPNHNGGAYQHGPRKGYNQALHNASIPPTTPPRSGRSQRQPGQNHRQTPTSVPGSSPNQPSSNPQRSSSEILKTLLRKKACLYEPDTSRSVALVTWLVGRELALEYGFFSRQQLQSGVHACVANKIDSGTITRTKVNRCMQIILNSCFHYIIPRSDGTEEKGDSFRNMFSQNVQDDSFLLAHLPAPWNDLVVKKEIVIHASLNDGEEVSHFKNLSTPKTSPKLSSVNADKSPVKESTDGDIAEAKRAVLLCFNENVRSAEDVFRCHNEFIRDTANAAHLQLTAQEWRAFFGREAARAPYLWGNVGIPMSAGESQGSPSRQSDILGQMSQDEAGKFRTTWCTKRYDHDHDLCGFAHVEVNGGWLRRNPTVYAYKDEMCPHVSTARDKRISPSFFFLNECPKGVNCEKAHSMEEILYHPNRYKCKVCASFSSKSGGCHLGDVCPDLHPFDTTKPLKKSAESRSHSSRHSRKSEQVTAGTKNALLPPTGSPVVYASPAPLSSFESQLAMPGLQNLFRRHSSVIRAHFRTSGKCRCSYSCFGDDWGISNASPPRPQTSSGLPSTRGA